ncbi:trehalose-phosphatase [Thermobifida fusca]|jgi:trehalose 6-phosphate phosphatase|uniref:Trehalose 6-phosphate phosphatase n=2 Tax=Thermobifida fusca TaxID=2021 RepID=A0A9P2TDW5_THEFU|nr:MULTISPECIES: trehalose-phosphatase [Thermobifida]EOR72655.1 trehalose-phosphatase [Thermobifida fusca TM51]MBO2529869.1 trehalose-phosphatase [Thermobifida sp.]MDD6792587.1 trehalose-phosphatase [Thermobifida fusca]PPS94021.1 trehalose phosphatase [Thermobifida fusca]PZN61619.1 MAG: trehalose-phosphatase [Thermobifida fusca]
MSLLQSTTQSGKVALDRIRDMPDRAVCAFDFDGTLAPIVPDPRDSRAHPGAVPALRALAGRVRAVAVITGRPAQTAVDYGGLDAVPGITVLGHYGRERWEDGKLTVPEPPPGVAMVREALPGLLDEVGAPEGTWIEDKKHALAVHTRRTADPEAALELLRAPLADLAKRAELAVEPGRMVIELRPPGVDKGAALTDLVTRLGAEAVLYAGDDLGDLAAYDAVERLREQGVAGFKLCSGSAEVTELARRADAVVPGPEGVVAFLEELVAAVGG